MGRKNQGRDDERFQLELAIVNRTLNKISLRAKDGRLYLRGVFPPKPGASEPKRTDLATGCNATLSGLKIAKQKAEEMDALLVLGRFDWSPYLKGEARPAETIGDWIKRFEKHYWETNIRTPSKVQSFHREYELAYAKLPQDAPLAIAVLKETILTHTQPGSRSRKGYAMVYRRLAELAALPQEDLKKLAELGKGYSPNSVQARELPTDGEILDVWHAIRHPAWKWVYAVMAIYGIRPHEVYQVYEEGLSADPPILEVKDTSKTGRRLAYPARAIEWDEFTLEIIQYPNLRIDGQSNNQIGSKISQGFSQQNTPFPPYHLRHAYARRLYLRGFPSDFIAKSMGHSLSVQLSVYRAWWGDQAYRETYDRIMKNWEDSKD